jgi:hypothetical protein
VVSSRWSYGPDGLREREVEAKLLWPRWRDLQPVLLRSAGVVGLVATIMAVVSSDALRFGGGEEPAALAAVDPVTPPIVAPASEFQGAPEAAAEEATAAAPEAATQEEAAASLPQPIVAAPASEPQSATPAPIMVTTVSIPLETSPAAPDAEIADLIGANVAPGDEPELEVPPIGVAAAAEPGPIEQPAVLEAAPSSPILATVEQPPSPAVIPVRELRDATTPAPPTREMAATSSVAPLPEAFASLAPNASDEPAAEISLSALRPSDRIAAANPDASMWPDGAATCPRDWVEAEGSRDDGSAACISIDSLFAMVGPEEQSTLENAAAEQATVLAALPRIPLPRPEPPADFKPSNPHKTVRVNSRNASWPPDPPPNCAAGQHAKWRFVDRKAGTKEWYCR